MFNSCTTAQLRSRHIGMWWIPLSVNPNCSKSIKAPHTVEHRLDCSCTLQDWLDMFTASQQLASPGSASKMAVKMVHVWLYVTVLLLLMQESKPSLAVCALESLVSHLSSQVSHLASSQQLLTALRCLIRLIFTALGNGENKMSVCIPLYCFFFVECPMPLRGLGPMWASACRVISIDPLHFLAGCRTRQKSQAVCSLS